MSIVKRKLTKTFADFFDSERSSGILIMVCTALSLIFTNSILGDNYLSIWQGYIGGMSVEHWINDGLMAVFFFLIGLELRRELLVGELSEMKSAMLPMFAAVGGVVLPALIHFSLNFGTATQAGIGIPMATDIAFALGVLALLGSRVPASLKVFLTALAVIDDLAAIVVIAVFYTAKLSLIYMIGAMAVFILLLALNHLAKIRSVAPYLIGGVLLWFLMLQSGVHATIAGVLLAFTIPFSSEEDEENSALHTLEQFLHKPVAFIILPIFALANTGIIIGSDWF
ncbi:MAG: Na+/H+ antiporter NhaA, partial [Saprospiraceae bacterium]|nr:Na+/H+ antiporter NhaA [Pyrinomonadaceae bacterium]